MIIHSLSLLFDGAVLAVRHQLTHIFPQIVAISVPVNGVYFFFGSFLYNSIECESESIVDHARNQLLEKRRGAFQAGVFVDLYQPYF